MHSRVRIVSPSYKCIFPFLLHTAQVVHINPLRCATSTPTAPNPLPCATSKDPNRPKPRPKTLAVAAMSELDLEAGVAAAPTKAAAKLEGDLNAKANLNAKATALTPCPTKVDEGTPSQQWDFVRKLYAIILVQHCLGGSLVAVTCFVPGIPLFFTSSPSVATYFTLVAIALAPFIGSSQLARITAPTYYFFISLNSGVISLIVQRYDQCSSTGRSNR